MGGRVEGKTKKKSVKANVTSKFGSKRKASRMGKKVKKGQSGPSTEFITRSTALKKLQITLKDFRRYIILLHYMLLLNDQISSIVPDCAF